MDGLTYVPISDIGMEREENQDYQGQDLTPHGFLFVVADGMGGHAGGATASQMAVNHIKRAMREVNIQEPDRALEYAVRYANQLIWQKSQARADLRGMGSTVVTLLLAGEVAWLAHVGDSRIYLLRGDRLMQLTKDHTMVQRLLDEGLLDEESARHHPTSHVLSRSLGGLQDVYVEIFEAPIRVQQGDIFFMCSDGLTGMLYDEEIATVLMDYEPHDAARILVDEANARGGHDNITIALIRVDQVPLREVFDPTQRRPDEVATLDTLPAMPPLQLDDADNPWSKAPDEPPSLDQDLAPDPGDDDQDDEQDDGDAPEGATAPAEPAHTTPAERDAQGDDTTDAASDDAALGEDHSAPTTSDGDTQDTSDAAPAPAEVDPDDAAPPADDATAEDDAPQDDAQDEAPPEPPRDPEGDDAPQDDTPQPAAPISLREEAVPERGWTMTDMPSITPKEELDEEGDLKSVEDLWRDIEDSLPQDAPAPEDDKDPSDAAPEDDREDPAPLDAPAPAPAEDEEGPQDQPPSIEETDDTGAATTPAVMEPAAASPEMTEPDDEAPAAEASDAPPAQDAAAPPDDDTLDAPPLAEPSPDAPALAEPSPQPKAPHEPEPAPRRPRVTPIEAEELAFRIIQITPEDARVLPIRRRVEPRKLDLPHPEVAHAMMQAPAPTPWTLVLVAAAAALAVGVLVGFVGGRAPIDGLRNELTSTQQQRDNLQGEANNARENLDLTRQKLSSLEQDAELLRKNLQATQDRGDDLQRQRDALQTERDNLQEQLRQAQNPPEDQP
jgi:serine/threonine protein phosphatase PrpC/uncharacterized membrane-anchored protein YhcB (DUF1043 family)